MDETHLAHVFAVLGEPKESELCDPAKIRATLRELALQRVAHAVALRVAHSIRMDCGNIDTTPVGCHEMDVGSLSAAFMKEAERELSRISSYLNQLDIKHKVRKEFSAILGSLEADTDDWKSWIPGRPLLKQFAARAKQDVTRLKTVFIREAVTAQRDPFSEIRQIFSEFR